MVTLVTVSFVVVGLLAAVTPLLAGLSRGLNRLLTRAALQLFGTAVEDAETRDERTGAIESTRLKALRGAHVAQTYRVYASKTLLYAALVGLGVSLIGVFVVRSVFILLGLPAAVLRARLPIEVAVLVEGLTQPALSPVEAFVLFVLSGLTFGTLAAVVVYQGRWWWPGYQARERARQIDASMERTIAFIYALSRSGMAFPKVMSVLARNQRVYGEAAREVEVAVRDMETFNADLVGALQRLNRRTPSEYMGEFTENLVSVLRSGQDLGTFLRDQYDRYHEESEAQQQRFLELLATLAEAYVTVLVAGPLFLITTLVILGLIVGGTLPFLRFLGYGLIPLATIGFVIYLDSLSVRSTLRAEPTNVPADLGEFLDIRQAEAEGEARETVVATTDSGETAAADGGTVSGGSSAEPLPTRLNRGRLAAYDRLRWLRVRLRDPLGFILEHPTAIFWLTIPAALLYAGIVAGAELSRWARFLAAGAPPGFLVDQFPLRVVDDVVIQGAIFVLGSFGLVYELRQRRLRRIEAVMPDFLDRLASANEAGMPIVGSLERVANSDLGALNTEVERTRQDIRWGTSVQAALHRLERRIRTPTVTRAATLITNAMQASGDLGPVLRIAADEAKASRRLQLQRRQELLTYVVVIYVSFFVFLTIIVALTVAFLPAIPTPSEFGQRLSAGFGGIPKAQKEAFELMFFHSVIVQAVCSGLVAGQMGQGSPKDGVKHAAIMLTIAYAVFLFFG